MIATVAFSSPRHMCRPRRSCTLPQPELSEACSSSSAKQPVRPRPVGRILIVHANAKPYGTGPIGATSDVSAVSNAALKAKASNRNFSFSCADYERMRDSGRPYSGDPRKNNLLPLPRPTYTEFINRAKKAKLLDKLDFLFCAPDAPKPPRIDPAIYDLVVWCGVSFRRFTRLWTPERNHFFPLGFQARALAVLCCAHRQRITHPQSTHLGTLPADLLLEIIAAAAEKHETAKEDYDSLETCCNPAARHLFLPAPGSSGHRDHLFDAAFGL